MVQPWDRKRLGDAATTRRGAERRSAPPTRHSPVTSWAKMGGEEKPKTAPEETMEEEEWAPGPGREEGWGTGWVLAALYSLVRVRISLYFFNGGLGPYYVQLGRSGAQEPGI